MPEINFLLLHVADHAASALYHTLLGIPIVEQKEDIALLPMRDDVMLGLWSRDIEPASSGKSGASEVTFAVADAAAVESTHAAWRQHGLTILQPPTRMSFGTTFVGADPDGHRLRVFAPPAA